MKIRGAHPLNHRLLEFGQAAARRAGPAGIAKMALNKMVLAIVDARDPIGGGVLQWHFETSGGYDERESAEQVQEVIERAKMDPKATPSGRPLRAFWIPMDLSLGLVAKTTKMKLRKGECWVVIAFDGGATRFAVDYLTDEGEDW